MAKTKCSSFFPSKQVTVNEKKRSVARSLLALKLKHQWSKIATVNFMNAANEANRQNNLPPIFPKTFYSLERDAELQALLCKVGLDCQNCQRQILLAGKKVCPHCASNLLPSDIMASDHFFCFNLTELIKLKLEKTALADQLASPDRYSNYSDGHEYLKIIQSRPGKKVITLQISCDGVEISDLSKKQIWPLFVKINELDLAEDRKVFLYSCHIGRSKPDVEFYLDNLVRELNDLNETGVFIERLNEIVYPVLLNCLFDLPARSHFLQHAGHTAKSGCTICNVSGESLALDPNNPRKHKVIFRPSGVREYKSKHLYERDRDELIDLGILGVSKLNSITYADCFQICPTEPMHQIFIGFVSRFLESMFLFKFKDSICSLYGQESVLDQRIKLFGSMEKFKRNPRPVSQRKNFNAGDHLIWFFYVGPVVLKGVLSKKGYAYWMTLVYVVSNYWSGLEKTELDFNHELIRLLLEDLQEVFSESEYTMNAHQLLHLKELVHRFGPLSQNNSFIYEAANGDCRRLVTGAFGVNEQIANQVSYRFNLDLDKAQNSKEELRLGNEFEHKGVKCFKKLVKGGKMFTSLFYHQNSSSCSSNFAFRLVSGEVVFCRYFFKENGDVFFKGKILSKQKGLKFTYDRIKLNLDYIFYAKSGQSSRTFKFSDVD